MADPGMLTLVWLGLAAFATGVLHGSVGLAGGVLMAAILAHSVGIKAAVPIMTVALLFSHSSRVLLFYHDTDWPVVKRVLLFGLPTIVLGAWIFTIISARTVAIIFATFLLASFPIKSFAKKHKIKTGPKLLAGASAVWGMLAGNVIGPGFFLTPFLQGTGMSRQAFVGSMAMITLVMNATKLAVFGLRDVMNVEWLVLGCVFGLITIPGNYIGKKILLSISDEQHGWIINLLTIAMIANFVYLAVTG